MLEVYDFRMQLHSVGGHEITFEIHNQDTSDANWLYYGYISDVGSWIIQRFHIIDSTHRIYQYAAGKDRADYDAHWNAVTGVFTNVPALTFTTKDQLGDYL